MYYSSELCSNRQPQVTVENTAVVAVCIFNLLFWSRSTEMHIGDLDDNLIANNIGRHRHETTWMFLSKGRDKLFKQNYLKIHGWHKADIQQEIEAKTVFRRTSPQPTSVDAACWLHPENLCFLVSSLISGNKSLKRFPQPGLQSPVMFHQLD